MKQVGAKPPAIVGDLLQMKPAGLAVISGLEGAPIPFEGLTRAELTLGREGIHLAASGTEAALKSLQGQIEMGIAQIKSLADAKVAEGKAEGEGEAFGAIWASHHINAVLARIKPRLEKNRLTIDLPMEVSGSTFMTLGMISGMAIPAFTRYMDRSKAAQEELMPTPEPDLE
jgi:hypothetical protein